MQFDLPVRPKEVVNIEQLIKRLEERIAESSAMLSDDNWIRFSNRTIVDKLRETTIKDQHALANAYLAFQMRYR